MASDLSEYEKELAKEFVAAINRDSRHAQQERVTWSEGIKFLMARKFDLQRAIELYWNYQQTKSREKLYDINPCNETISRELLSGKLTILGSRDPEGSAIALFTARLHKPSSSNQISTLQALFWQLDTALNRIQTQRNGLIFIYDMTGATYGNFNYDLSNRILQLLKGSFPARLKKVLIVQPPLWFKAPFSILRVFLREKLRDRVYVMDDAVELVLYIGETAASERLSSPGSSNHVLWLKACLQERGVPEQACNEFFRAVDVGPHFSGQPLATLTPATVQPPPSISSTSLSPTPSVYTLAPSAESRQRTSAITPLQPQPPPTVGQPPTVKPPTVAPPPPPAVAPPPPPIRLTPLLPNSVTSLQQATQTGAGQVNGSLQSGSSQVVRPPAAHITRLPEESQEPHRQSSASELDLGESSDDCYDSIHNTDLGNSLNPQELIERVKRLRRHGLFQEYSAIKVEPLCGTFNAAKDKANAGKNRYTDVLCYDHSRVVLDVEGHDPSSDYINANFADGYKHRDAYICTMGPMPKTFNDFWRMVWQEHVRTIVMTTKTAEKGRVKCGQYWPMEGHMATDSFDIINTGAASKGDYDVTSLQITHRPSGHTRTITHFLFLSWPDYGIPSSPAGFLRFLEDVRDAQASATHSLGSTWKGHPEGPPVVTHCSAGIGRTGTFLTVDICLRQLVETGRTNVCETVRRVRTQRAFSIQMPDQYLFCHLAVIEYAKMHDFIADVEDLSPYLSEEGN